ncbi:MAG: hypothetical protein D3M94_15820 [Rhodocyclales bacterium GT-UBC]|nr:MAG: hypothetical protein D3M94_15820 [Rhodocyclales bacterium GT-UBC]
MNSRTILRLNTSPEQVASLERLQAAFAQVCSALWPVVRENRCWNRVALHHLTYHKLREQFPALGSQMVCNAIYSVCRMARFLFQNKASPWSLEKRPGMPLPMLEFAPTAPVYFDRHTLSIRLARLSMYSLDGRMRFDVDLSPEDDRRFKEEKLKEIVMSRDDQGFFLMFFFGEDAEKPVEPSELPQYVVVLEPEALVA